MNEQHEFSNVNTKLYLANLKGAIKETTIDELIPDYITSSDLSMEDYRWLK